MPDGLNDRAEDCWEPLTAIGDVAGGDWPQSARAAAVALSSDSDDEDEHARGVVLIAAIQHAFDAIEDGRISSVDLIRQLALDDESPFAEWWDDDRGKPVRDATRKLARLLRPFEIRSKKIRFEEKTRQGYELEQLDDAFARYPAPDKAPEGGRAA